MTFDERIQTAKPYLVGFAAGLIAAPIVAFSLGWVSTSSASATAVENARVGTLVGICTSTAGRMASEQNADLATFKTYDNRVKRGELVAAAIGSVQMPEELVKKVTSDCNRALS